MNENEVKIVRTMANTLVIGEVQRVAQGTQEGYRIDTPFNVIPMKEGIKLYPMDIELVGKQIESVVFTDDKIYYVTDPSKVLIDEYTRLKNGEAPEQPEVEGDPAMPAPDAA
jgi:hypothetical protein